MRHGTTMRELEAPPRYVVTEGVLATAPRLLLITRPYGVTTSITEARGYAPQGRLSELRGAGKEIWREEDAQAYVSRLRGEWDR